MRRHRSSLAWVLLLVCAQQGLAAEETGGSASGSPPAQTEPAEPTTAPLASEAAPPASTGDFRSKVYGYKSAAGGLKRPAGTVTVTADQSEWQQAGVTRAAGNVHLTMDTLELRGDTLEFKQFEDGRLDEAHLAGSPAHLNDAGADGAPPITAHARKMDYDARTGTIQLTGGAVLTRGPDKLSGDNIRYDVAARRVQAAGGNSGQVRIVIQPTPAPAPKSERPQPQNPQEPAPAAAVPAPAESKN